MIEFLLLAVGWSLGVLAGMFARDWYWVRSSQMGFGVNLRGKLYEVIEVKS